MRLPVIFKLVGLLAPLSKAAPSALSKRQGVKVECDGLEFKMDDEKAHACWKAGYDLKTNFYEKVPDGKELPKVVFEITETEAGPDGFNRPVLAVNGKIPGPKIEANWGDTIVIEVKNSLKRNGTSIHFHGIRQHGTSFMDGTSAVTQCPIAPGDSIIYKWKAEQYGTTWYHSHYGLQAWDGVFGPIVIHGPASAPYDIDLEPVLLSDWAHKTSDEVFAETFAQDGYATIDNGLINGKNVYGKGGEHHQIKFTPGMRHRLRLINTAIDTTYQVSLDGHEMKVIAADLVPINPFPTTFITLSSGQRYDVIIEGKKEAGDFWLRAVPDPCGSTSISKTDANDEPISDVAELVKAIVYYGEKASPPKSSPNPPEKMNPSCQDMPIEKLTPVVEMAAGKGDLNQDVNWSSKNYADDNLIYWTINDTPFFSNWSQPTLNSVITGNATLEKSRQIIDFPDANKWLYFVIQKSGSLAHPIHIHGHDFFILAQGAGEFDSSKAQFPSNPPRRDVALLPGGGYVVVAIQADNPGVWLLHCHIGWHSHQGMALQVLERAKEIPDTFKKADFDKAAIEKKCSTWRDWARDKQIEQHKDPGP